MKQILAVALIAALMALSQRAVGADPSNEDHVYRYPVTSKNETKDGGTIERATRLEAAAEAIGKLDPGEVSASDQSKLLKLAASLAELAGQDKDATHLREEAEKDHPPLNAGELIARRQAQRDALQRQIDGLRRLTGTEQQIQVDVKVVEFSPAKLQQAGVQLSELKADGLPGTVIKSEDKFFERLEELRAKSLVKCLAEPTLITLSGRPASFNSGGELPFVQRTGKDEPTVEFKQFGTRVDLLAISTGNDTIRLEVRSKISAINKEHVVEVGGVKTPGLSVREVDTGFELKSGQTCVVAGLVQAPPSKRLADSSATDQGKKADAEKDSSEQIQLLFLVTPRLIAAPKADAATPAADGSSGYYGPASGSKTSK